MYQLVRIPPLTSAAVSTFRIAQVVRLRLYSVHVVHASEVVEGRPVSDFLHGSCCFTELRGGLGSIFCCGTGDQLESKTLGRVRWVVPNSTGRLQAHKRCLMFVCMQRRAAFMHPTLQAQSRVRFRSARPCSRVRRGASLGHDQRAQEYRLTW